MDYLFKNNMEEKNKKNWREIIRWIVVVGGILWIMISMPTDFLDLEVQTIPRLGQIVTKFLSVCLLLYLLRDKKS